jgi:hypothetical protein
VSTVFERLAQGPANGQAADFRDWNEMVGAAPRGQFRRQATEAVQQLDPQEYYRHTQPGVDGTDPLGELAPRQRTGLAQTILSRLRRAGVDPEQVSRDAGVRTVDPRQMSPAELAAVAQWMQRNHPEVLGQAAAQYQDQPDLLSRLLGNKALLAAAAGLAANFLADRSRRG